MGLLDGWMDGWMGGYYNNERVKYSMNKLQVMRLIENILKNVLKTLLKFTFTMPKHGQFKK